MTNQMICKPSSYCNSIQGDIAREICTIFVPDREINNEQKIIINKVKATVDVHERLVTMEPALPKGKRSFQRAI